MFVLGKPSRSRYVVTNAVMQPDQAAIPCADPQLSRKPCVQRLESAGAETRKVLTTEDSEAHTIETRKPRIRGQPEISITVLHHRAYRVVRQTLFGLPYRGNVLCRMGLCVDGRR